MSTSKRSIECAFAWWRLSYWQARSPRRSSDTSFLRAPPAIRPRQLQAARGWGRRASRELKHIFVIMMENTSYSDLLNPSNANTTFIQSIANTYGLETNYSGVTHVSLPNYIAATSGSNWGSNSDDVAQAPLFDHTNLADQLDGANVSWKAYMEDLPSAGRHGGRQTHGMRLYVRRSTIRS